MSPRLLGPCSGSVVTINNLKMPHPGGPLLQRLADAVAESDNRDPWCFGTHSAPPKELYLSYGKGYEAR